MLWPSEDVEHRGLLGTLLWEGLRQLLRSRPGLQPPQALGMVGHGYD